MWAIRDDVGQVAQFRPVFAFDISVPLNHMNGYVEEMKDALTAKWPSNQCMVFGHLGDGNLHVVVGVGDKGAKQAVEAVVYEGA